MPEEEKAAAPSGSDAGPSDEEEPVAPPSTCLMAWCTPGSRTWVLRNKLWLLLDDPESSNAAQALTWFTVLVIATSILNFAVGSYPDDMCGWELECGWGTPCTGKAMQNIEDRVNGVSRTCSGTRLEEMKSSQMVETICIMIFTVEYILRLLTSGTVKPLCRFFFEPFNLLDLIAILPWYLVTILTAVAETTPVSPEAAAFDIRTANVVNMTSAQILAAARAAAGVKGGGFEKVFGAIRIVRLT